MNAFDYFFENTSSLEKLFLVGKEEISYKDLYTKSLSLSEYIKNRIGEKKSIMLISPNSVFFLMAYLAIFKSGNTCIPLDPMIEEDSYKSFRELTDTALVFASEQVHKRLAIDDKYCITPSTLPKENSNVVGKKTDDFDTERCAEIIFTSGSTGIPKGVMLSHKNIIANTKSIIEYLQLNENDRMLCVLPFYYCYGLSLLHTHLRVGGSMVFNNSFIFLGAVINDLKNQKCTGFAGVPSHFQILLRKSDAFKTTEFSDLKYVTQAGGKLAPVFIDEFREALPKVKFIVMYGQTEATARLSYLPPDMWEQRKGSIGKGIPGVQLRVVNNKDEIVKPGEIGEVVAKGDNVMMGYYKDKESSDSTIRNGWLYTGDIGTIDDDGYIYLTARKKEIIKVGGKRISPKEIEAVILSMPEVVDCSIEAVDDELQGEALKATVIVNNNSEKNIDEKLIQEHCSKNLELYKIPRIFEIKANITMSATGKKIKSKIKI